MGSASLREQLTHYGAPLDSVIELHSAPSPDQIEFLDLFRSYRASAPLLDAVVRIDHRPVLYAIAGPVTPERRRDLQRVLAQRGQADYLAVVEPGSIRAYPLVLNESSSEPLASNFGDAAARLFIPSIVQELNANNASTSQALHDALLRLLNAAVKAVRKQGGLSVDDALSLVGRAVFLRFLLDRGVVTSIHLSSITEQTVRLTDLFSTPALVAETCKWLDSTFNADLLPLTDAGGSAMWKASPAHAMKACAHLTDILYKRDVGGQVTLEWAGLDFSHIPVGLLSQVYEAHYHAMDKSVAKSQSVYYTPQAIAQYMVSEVFASVGESDSPRVLDPAAGAGVFLTTAFRALVAARWRRDGQQPGTAAIREVLYNQLAGFDINESALRLSALSLYLTALELDPKPHPIDALRFRSLRDTILFDVRSVEDKKASNKNLPQIGALGAHVSQTHVGAYDIIIGNPPWTAWTAPSKATEAGKSRLKHMVAEVEKVTGAIAARRLPSAFRAELLSLDAGQHQVHGAKSHNAKKLAVRSSKPVLRMVDKVPDVPFVWRAMEWARPGTGRIAFALSARMLFKRTPAGSESRARLFRSLKVTGILNAAALRNTDVWPKVTSPFCVVFAENSVPRPHDIFRMLSPMKEDAINRKGHLRIDPYSVVPVHVERMIATPSMLKTLFRGTYLDLELLAKIRSNPSCRTLGEYWKQHGLHMGQGYQDADGNQSSDALHGCPELTLEFTEFVEVDVARLPIFSRPKLHRVRNPAIYRTPLVLARKAVRPSASTVRAHFVSSIASKSVVYCESFYGFSCCGHPESERLAKYLTVLFHSDLVYYWMLMESSEFGVEREAIHVDDLSDLPFVPLELLGKDVLSRLDQAFGLVRAADEKSVDAANKWVSEVFSLTTWDTEVIRDAVRTGSPFAEDLAWSQEAPAERRCADFGSRLVKSLAPFLPQDSIATRTLLRDASVPWYFLAVGKAPSLVSVERPTEIVADAFLEFADTYCASQLIVQQPKYSIIGILAQNRWWTDTRARLLASELLRDEPEWLNGAAHT